MVRTIYILKILVTLLLGSLALFATLGFYVVSTSDVKMESLVGIVPAVSLSIGVLIGWLTYLANLKHNREKDEYNFSFSYLSECIYWFNKALEVIESRSSDNRFDIYNQGLSLVGKLERLEEILENIDILQNEITIEKHMQIYRMHKVNLKRKLYEIFENVDPEVLGEFHYGPNEKPLTERLCLYNEMIKEKKDRGSAEDKWYIAAVGQRISGTPFPYGLSKMKLVSILKFFGDDKNISQSQLISVKGYLELCDKYINDGGFIIEKNYSG